MTRSEAATKRAPSAGSRSLPRRQPRGRWLAIRAFVLTAMGLVASSVAGRGVPRALLPVMVPGLDSLGPEHIVSVLGGPLVAVDRAGHLLFTTSFNLADLVLTEVDSAGRLIRRTGRRGDGPGELGTGPAGIALTDSTITVFTIVPPRFVVLDRRGTPVYTSHPITLGVLGGLFADSADILPVSAIPGAPIPRIHRVSVRTLAGRVIVDTGVAAYRALALAPSDTAPIRLLRYATNGSDVLVANSRLQRATVFSSAGIPLYNLTDYGPILHWWIDEQKLVWGVAARARGRDNDSSVVQVFQRGLLARTFVIPCGNPIGGALTSPFLAVLCEQGTRATDKGLDLRLFRIVR